MPTKHAKPRLVAKRKVKGSGIRVVPKKVSKKPAKSLPDTSRIPWFPPIPKTGTDA